MKTSGLFLLTVITSCLIVTIVSFTPATNSESSYNSSIDDDRLLKKFTKYPVYYLESGYYIARIVPKVHNTFAAIILNQWLFYTSNAAYVYDKYIKNPANVTLFVIYCQPDDIPTVGDLYKWKFCEYLCTSENSTTLFVKHFVKSLTFDVDIIKVVLHRVELFVAFNFTAETARFSMEWSFQPGNTVRIDLNPLKDERLSLLLKREYDSYVPGHVHDDEIMLPPSLMKSTTPMTYNGYRPDNNTKYLKRENSP